MRGDPYEADLMRQCQRGVTWQGGGSGSFCRKQDLCRSEGRCHFVAQEERNRGAWVRPFRGRIVWSPDFDSEAA